MWKTTTEKEHRSSFSSSENLNTSQSACGREMYSAGLSGCGGLWYVGREGPLSTHGEFTSLSNVEAKIFQPCETPAKSCLPFRSVVAEKKKEKKKAWRVSCVFQQQQAWFPPSCSGSSHKIHISHRALLQMSCMLTLPENTWLFGGTLGSTGVRKSHTDGSFGCSIVTANQFRLYSCCAHSLGCCWTLAPGLIKTLIAERTGAKWSLNEHWKFRRGSEHVGKGQRCKEGKVG